MTLKGTPLASPCRHRYGITNTVEVESEEFPGRRSRGISEFQNAEQISCRRFPSLHLQVSAAAPASADAFRRIVYCDVARRAIYE